MSMWDKEHEFGFQLLGSEDEFDDVLCETQKSDPTAVLKKLGINTYIFCDGKTAAMMCKLKATSVRPIRPPK